MNNVVTRDARKVLILNSNGTGRCSKDNQIISEPAFTPTHCGGDFEAWGVSWDITETAFRRIARQMPGEFLGQGYADNGTFAIERPASEFFLH